MTSVNAELYHREFDRKNEKYARELEEREAERYSKLLAKQIRAALTSAEQHLDEGFQPYAYVFGYLAGDCTEDEQAEFEERFSRLVRQSSAEEQSNG